MKSGIAYRILIFCSLVIWSSTSWGVFAETDTEADMLDSLVYIQLTRGACSGVLIAKNVVLSAAHCKDMLGKPIRAVLLSEKTEDKICNQSQIIDSTYTPGSKAIFPKKVHAPDMVAFRLETELCGAQPARLSDFPLQPKDVVSLAGFGGGSGLWYNSKQIELEIIKEKGAAELSTSKDRHFVDLLELSSGYFAYATPLIENTTACIGDSGSPVFVNRDGVMELHGITGAVFPNDNLGAEKCNRGYLHLITDIAPYADWLKDLIGLWK